MGWPKEKKAIYDRERRKLPERKEQIRLACQRLRERKRSVDPLYRSIEARKQKYGISREDFFKLLTRSKGKCDVCGSKFDTAKKEPCVDHCHGTNAIRGLLCQRCNVAEGAIKTPENALKLYEYMLRNELFYLAKDTGLS